MRYLTALRIGSVLYLSVGWMIFLGMWLRPGWAVAALVLHAYVIARYSSTAVAGNPSNCALFPTERISSRSALTIVCIAIAWVSLSGAGGVGFQNLPDWNNKNVLMNDLIARDWPVSYDYGRVLNYYFALYLPASLVGRMAGWNAAQWFLYGEVLVGASLSLLWVYALSGTRKITGPVVFVVFGGLDIVGYLATRHHAPDLGGSIEWWARTLQFSGNTTLLFWVPQHCLVAWIVTALILDEAIHRRRATYVGLFVGLSVLWSPFVTLGLIPVAVAAVAIAARKSLVSVGNVVYLPVVAGLALVFFGPHTSGAELDSGLAPWTAHFSRAGLATIAVFLLLEVGVYGIIVASRWRVLERDWRMIAIVAAIATPLWVLAPEQVGHGGFNMRSSIPTLMLVCLLVVRLLASTTLRGVWLATSACLLLGAVSAVQEITRSIRHYPATIPAPRPTIGVLGLTPRHTREFVMPMGSSLYRLLVRSPAESLAHSPSVMQAGHPAASIQAPDNRL